MGPYKGLKEARRVVEDCMANIHPIYHIKELMIKRELAKDPDLVNESWDRFLPHFKKRTLSKRRKPFKITDKSKKVYTPFPPPQEKSKVDLQMESGEYFLGMHAKERVRREVRLESERKKREDKQKERVQAFIPPHEPEVEKEARPKRADKGDGVVSGRKKKARLR